MPGTGKMAAAPQGEGIQQRVLAKLIIFAILMAVVPIGTYFATLKFIWEGNPTYSAICAVLAANIVLAGYVYLAFTEEDAPVEVSEKKVQ